MYRNQREQLHLEIEKNSQADSKAKLEELNRQIEQLEKQKRLHELREQELADQKAADEEKRKAQNKGFLGGIKSYSIEDI